MSFSDATLNVFDILSSTVQSGTNTLLCQLGNVATATVYTDNAQLWQQVGLASLPSDAGQASGAGQALIISTSQNDVILGTRDIRFQSQLGSKFGPGDTILYATGVDGEGQPRVMLSGSTGNITLYTTYQNTPNGLSLGMFIDAQEDSIMIVNAVGNGIVIDKDGVHLTLANGAAGIDLFNGSNTIQIASSSTSIVGQVVLGQGQAPVTPATVGVATGISISTGPLPAPAPRVFFDMTPT